MTRSGWDMVRNLVVTTLMVLAVPARGSSSWLPPVLVHPAPGAENVPVNTVLMLVGDATEANTEVRDGSGRLVSMQESVLVLEHANAERYAVVVLVPQEPLASLTGHSVRTSFPAWGPDTEVYFNTGAGNVAERAEVPVVDGIPRPNGAAVMFNLLMYRRPGCPGFTWMDIHAPGAALLVVDRVDNPLPDLRNGQHGVVTASPGESVRLGLAFGEGERCLGGMEELRVGAFNAAGEFAGWSRPFRPALPITDGCTSTRPSTWVTWCVLVVLLRARRPRVDESRGAALRGARLAS